MGLLVETFGFEGGLRYFDLVLKWGCVYFKERINGDFGLQPNH
jgi:hypothetical protein